MPPEAETGDAPAKTAAAPAAEPKAAPTPVAAPAAKEPPAPPELSLDEFAREAVERGSAMELVNAFHAVERAKGPRKATLAEFTADFDAFAKAPA